MNFSQITKSRVFAKFAKFELRRIRLIKQDCIVFIKQRNNEFSLIFNFLKMGLTWDEFLKLATVMSNLRKSIANFKNEEIEINEKNRKVAAAANNYEEFFHDLKYMQFMEKVRIRFSKIQKLCAKL